MNPELLSTASLRASPWGPAVTRILAAALDAADPAAAVEQYLRRAGELLYLGEQTYDLANYERVFLVGAGKAGVELHDHVGPIAGRGGNEADLRPRLAGQGKEVVHDGGPRPRPGPQSAHRHDVARAPHLAHRRIPWRSLITALKATTVGVSLAPLPHPVLR